MWYYDGANTRDDDILAHMVLKHAKSAELAVGLSRFWNLYNYLLKNPPTSTAQIRKSILVDKGGRPFFSDDVAERILQTLPIIKNTSAFAKSIQDRIKRVRGSKGMTGGVKREYRTDTQTIDEFVDWVVAIAGQKIKKVGFDPEQGTVMGKAAWVGSFIPFFLTLPQRLIPFLESQKSLGGPALVGAIEMLQELLPKFNLIQDVIITSISTPLAAIGVGFLTEAISIFIAMVLGAITFMLSLAQGKKGAAFVNLLQIIPIIGPIMRMIIVNGTQSYDAFQAHRKQFATIPVVGPLVDGAITSSGEAVTNALGLNVEPPSAATPQPTDDDFKDLVPVTGQGMPATGTPSVDGLNRGQIGGPYGGKRRAYTMDADMTQHGRRTRRRRRHSRGRAYPKLAKLGGTR